MLPVLAEPVVLGAGAEHRCAGCLEMSAGVPWELSWARMLVLAWVRAVCVRLVPFVSFPAGRAPISEEGLMEGIGVRTLRREGAPTIVPCLALAVEP